MPDNTSPSNLGALTGATIQALPIEHMIAGPLMAAQKAQVALSSAYVEFVKSVGLDKDGVAVMVKMIREESQLDESGAVKGTVKKIVEVPLLALVSHPNMNVDKLAIDFEMTIASSESDKSAFDASGSMSAKLGWGFLSVNLSGSVSHRSEQTRTTDTRAKYTVHVEGSRAAAPEGMMRVLDYLVNEATRPKVAPPSPTP